MDSWRDCDWLKEKARADSEPRKNREVRNDSVVRVCTKCRGGDLGGGVVRFFLLSLSGAGTNAEEIQGFNRARNPGAGDSKRRRRRKNFRRVCRPVAGAISGDSADVRRDARRRSGAQRSVVRNVSRALWRSHSADTAGGREGVFEAETAVAGAAAGSGRGAKACASDGDGSGAVLSESRGPRDAHSDA